MKPWVRSTRYPGYEQRRVHGHLETRQWHLETNPLKKSLPLSLNEETEKRFLVEMFMDSMDAATMRKILDLHLMNKPIKRKK